MRRRSMSALGLAQIITSLDAGAELAPKMYHIGWLGSAPSVAGENRAAGEFQQGLRDLKYVDGQNIVLEYRHASGNTERLSDFAAELVRSRVDVIVTAGEQADLAAKGATSAIPIVKPSITGSGISAINLPARARAAMTSMTPAISVASRRPSKPNCSITP